MAAAAPRPLQLRELLSACFSAGTLAGHVIRDVVREGGDLGMVNKADDKYDPQTVSEPSLLLLFFCLMRTRTCTRC